MVTVAIVAKGRAYFLHNLALYSVNVCCTADVGFDVQANGMSVYLHRAGSRESFVSAFRC